MLVVKVTRKLLLCIYILSLLFDNVSANTLDDANCNKDVNLLNITFICTTCIYLQDYGFKKYMTDKEDHGHSLGK